MFGMLRASVVTLGLMTILTGLAYPALVTVIARAAFPAQADGSLVTGADGKVVGSRLVGQSFANPKYFWGRPSATAPTPYNATASAGSNFGPLNPDLAKNARGRIDALRQGGLDANTPVPVDLATASGSGLDPHISPAAAEVQVERVALARKLTAGRVAELIERHTDRSGAIIGAPPRVNVLLLNIDLDAEKSL